MPEELKQEIKETLGFLVPDEDPTIYLNKEFKKADIEDPNDETAFKNM
jgi:hypothetical protein